MIRIMLACLLCLTFATALAAAADEPYRPVPMIKAVEPDTAKVGDAMTATGLHLDKSTVANLYLIQGDKTIDVKITNQSEEAIKFTVPDSAKPGRYQLMVFTAGTKQYLEEPVFFKVQ